MLALRENPGHETTSIKTSLADTTKLVLCVLLKV